MDLYDSAPRSLIVVPITHSLLRSREFEYMRV